MNQKIVIRNYTPKDKKHILLLMNEFADFLSPLDDIGLSKFHPKGNQYYTNRMLYNKRRKKGVIYIAEFENEIVGFIGGHIDRQTTEEKYSFIPLKIGSITEFYVTSGHRGKSIGKMLLKKVEEYFRQSGCNAIRFDLHARNKIAHTFYEKFGYKDRAVIMMKKI